MEQTETENTYTFEPAANSGLMQAVVFELDGHRYNIGKWPATVGREIMVKYPLSNLPKIADYGMSEEIMLKLMRHVEAVLPDGRPMRLETKALIDNHVPDWETLTQIEYASMRHNCSFFRNGKASAFLTEIASLAIQRISETLTASSEQ